MNYEELLEKARETYESEDTPHVVKAWLLANIIYPTDESEDERIRKALIEMIHDTTGDECEDCYHVSKESVLAWLEKQGDVNEISAEWSEKDEQMILSIEQVMNCASLLNIVPEKIDNIKSWLKSLRPQKQWKPSTAHKREIDDAYLQGICDAKHEIEKQGEQLDPDKVIGWLKTKVYDDSAYGMAMIEQFKKDFQL